MNIPCAKFYSDLKQIYSNPEIIYTSTGSNFSQLIENHAGKDKLFNFKIVEF